MNSAKKKTSLNDVNQLINFRQRQGGSNIVFNNPNASQGPEINK
jgi:hypothetical protein